MNSLYRLLPLLSHERYRSGPELAEVLGVTRPTVSNWVSELIGLGIDVYTTKGRGYRLVEPVSLLDRARVMERLSSELVRGLSVFDILSDVDSTNRWVLERPPEPGRWSVCAAEYQHSGRGRRGRSWQSPPASSIMMSAAVRDDLSGDALYAASLIVGVAVVRAIRATLGIAIELKWPNDIYYQGRKLGGILCELQGNPFDQPVVVIGLGLNVNQSPEGLGRSVGSLAELNGGPVDRNRLLAELLSHLHAVLGELRTPNGLAPLLDEWQASDCLKDRAVQLQQGETTRPVVAKGIDRQGQLLVASEDGRLEAVNGGEVSVRW